MGAPKGNQFWKLADPTKIGRNKLFDSPTTLWEKCKEYFQWSDSRKILKQDYKGKDSEMVYYELEVPYTLTALLIFLNIDENTWIRYRKEDSYKEFWEVVSHVDNIIYANKYDGASVGVFNPNIIARDLGLADRKDHSSTDGSMQPKVTVVNNGNKIDLSD